jgi:uncharacterized caspase-like protein
MRMARQSFFLTRGLLLLLLLLCWNNIAAAQQPQEKRVALVVGNGAYAKAPLATTANDAGLVAQSLQAAGFDVIGARDLDADSLRKTFRDFMQKVEADPANTVAMVYLAGYGVQLAGENYFVPVDSTINRDTDIPIEGLRVSDYTRELAAVPLKASIFVLDAARQQPFVEGGNPIASGLALVEAGPNSLIAFNAAPGTVAPTETGSYGLYAQSLAEMIRTGGLTLPDVFDRVRLRVSENSKGAQVPWDDQKITAQFTFFDRAPDAPKEIGAGQVAAIRDKPMRELSVTDAYAAALEHDTMQGYQDFLAAYPTDPMSKRVRAILAARREAITWRRTYLADTPQAYWSYLRRYPDGPHAWDARRRLTILNAMLEPPPSFAMIDYDVPPPPPDETVYVDRPVFYFGDPDFGFEPPPPPPVYFLPPPPPDFVVLAPPFAAVGLFVLPQPLFVPIPVYCRPPVYVAPPPNNIIFNNIHNTTVINNTINVAPTVQNNITAAAATGQTGAAPQVSKSLQMKAVAINKDPSLMPANTLVNTNAKTSTKQVFPVSNASTATTTNPPPQTAIKQGTATRQGTGTGTQLGTGTQPGTETQSGTKQQGAVQQGAKQLGTTQQGAIQQGTTQQGTAKPSDHALPTNLPPTGKGNEASKGVAPGTTGPGANTSKLGTTTSPTGAAGAKDEKATSTTSGKPTGTQATTNPSLHEHEKALQERRGASQPTTTTLAKPEVKPATPPPSPPPSSRPEAKRAAPPPPPPPKQEAKRFTPPPPPPSHAAAPPPRAAAPPPPPPRPPAPPPPRVAAPAPPPRPAPPPPPRPAPAAAKKCPPNQPRC